MIQALLIADSGGSKTDWCLIVNNTIKKVFSTASYHPQHVAAQWIDEQKKYWATYLIEFDIDLHFFGAGCLKQENRMLMENALREMGFRKVQVASDIDAAAKALVGNDDCVVGIMGTGSVIAEIKNQIPYKIHGGLGYILGDEGGGYHFGKLLLQKYFHGKLHPELNHFLEQTFGNKASILQKVYGLNGKAFVASLPEVTSNLNPVEIKGIHQENIRNFLSLYLPDKQIVKSISVVGSYAFYNQEILANELISYGWQLCKVTSRPIEDLAKYFTGNAF